MYLSFNIVVPFLIGLLYGQVKVVLKSSVQTQYIKQNFVDQVYHLTAEPGFLWNRPTILTLNYVPICFYWEKIPTYVFDLLSNVKNVILKSDYFNLLFSQDDANSLAREYMKHREHQRGRTLTNGSTSPSCLKVTKISVSV